MRALCQSKRFEIGPRAFGVAPSGTLELKVYLVAEAIAVAIARDVNHASSWSQFLEGVGSSRAGREEQSRRRQGIQGEETHGEGREMIGEMDSERK